MLAESSAPLLADGATQTKSRSWRLLAAVAAFIMSGLAIVGVVHYFGGLQQLGVLSDADPAVEGSRSLANKIGFVKQWLAKDDDGPATYNVKFYGRWLERTHPVQYPKGEGFCGAPHYSPLVVAGHDNKYRVWAEGELASTGVKDIAEEGIETELFKELDDLGYVHAISDFDENDLRGDITFETTITLTPETPMMTAILMVAPSPDWFTATHALNMRWGSKWTRYLHIPMFTYDAGTDSGESFTCDNAAENPFKPISIVRRGRGYFQKGKGPVSPVGSLTIKRVD